MTDERKQKQLQRYRRALKHIRTREEEQLLAEARRARAQQRRRRPAPDEDEGWQKIRRPERALGRSRREDQALPNTAESRATVVWLGRGRVRVLGVDGERTAVIAPALAQAPEYSVAVGDEVVLHERAGAEPRVAAVLPRRSELARTDPEHPGRRRVLAANVDLVVLVLTAERLRIGLVERLQLALRDSGAALAVCVNKCDLPHDEDARERALLPHRAAGVPVLVVSALRGSGLDDLGALAAGRTCAFVGHSGVGKSTLLNRLDPARARATAAVRPRDGRGRHTTSAASLAVLPDGTRLIDTPGVRAFGLPEGASGAADAFPEVAELALQCRFRDCAHVHEPGCAVRAAVEEGTLPESRYAAFRRLDG